ncbi:DUF5686 and carboxypeptidase regulatory-like domain-containing protein, partial [Parabacteroides sp. OttesenSCG-928-N08]|nr:DUF5686 and carboxypeptidase regulatory-like domain-containing protein [Parabacteroides sp. OttesenSCG-928-N08]
MKTIYWLIFMSCLVVTNLSAQTIRGEVVDTNDEVIPNATLFIRETSQGIMTDDQGAFQLTLKKGRYTIDFSSLGFERKRMEIDTESLQETLRVVLEKKTYTLKEVVVTSKREDPAYAIMRKAIGMAPFYLHQIQQYESEVYLKGTIRIDKMPSLIKIQIGDKTLGKSELTKKTFLIEAENRVSFTAPDSYKQHVVAFSSTVPIDLPADMMDIVTTSIYDPNAFGRISPLSPGAFSYYSFSWEGTAFEGSHLINKIKVSPKKKNAKLVSGYLYIIENSWNVQSAELTATEFGVTVSFTANYNEVAPFAFLPTAFDMTMSMDALGVKANGKYYSSIKYSDVKLNESQGVVRRKEQTPAPPIAEKPKNKKQEKAQKQLEALAEKEELSNRDAYKMAKLMEDIAEPQKKEETLELKFNSNIEVSVDSFAKKRDSTYWAAVRNIPLRQEEQESYRQFDDQYQLSPDSLTGEVTAQTRTGFFNKLLLGNSRRFGKDGKGHFDYGGVIGALPEYNFVDGLWIGQKFKVGRDIRKGYYASLTPSIYYTTARKALVWQLDARYLYAPIRNGELLVTVGDQSVDFANPEGDLRLINSLSSLLFGENPMKFYRCRMVGAVNRIDISNGLSLTTGISFVNRNALANHTSVHLFGGAPDYNSPAVTPDLMPDHKGLILKAGIEYTPRLYYWLRNGRKSYAHSAYPTFTFHYKKGISDGELSSPDYDVADLSIRQKVKLNPFDSFDYYLEAGMFLRSDRVPIADYHYFRTADLFVSGYSSMNSFSLLHNYAYATNDKWLQAHAAYSSAYLFIKHIPFLQNYLFNESLHARTLWVPGRNYSEVGYSAGFSDIGRIGVFVGFEQGKYNGVGF